MFFNLTVYAQGAQVDSTNTAKECNEYIQSIVTPIINAWQEKGEFESFFHYHDRVNDITRTRLVRHLEDSVFTIWKQTQLWKFYHSKFELSKYDADNQSFIVRTIWGDIILKVPAQYAIAFKKNWQNKKSITVFDGDIGFKNKQIIITKLSFQEGKEIFAFNSKLPTNYSFTDIQYNFKNLDFHIADEENTLDYKRNINYQAITLGDDKIDTDIPRNPTNYSSKSFVLIIGNEQYKGDDIPEVPYAINDAKTFKKYCELTLGIPNNHIVMSLDASYTDMVTDISSLKQRLSLDTASQLIFYFSGHGFPVSENNEQYLLASDSKISNIEKTAISLDYLYQQFSSVKEGVVFLDACFTGNNRGGKDFSSLGTRSIGFRSVETKKPGATLTVLAATNGYQRAWPYDNKHHGLFTYWLLESLQKSKGQGNLRMLFQDIQTGVNKTAIEEHGNAQIPTIFQGDETKPINNIYLNQ
ncbi:MAG: caspase family protein [Phycisphaerales bacterium]|nr:caspase family protein [Phycisphaerales bacterium]